MVKAIKPRSRKRTKGVSLVTLKRGAHVARYKDPQSGKWRQENLDRLGLKTDRARQEWAETKAYELEKKKRRTPSVQVLVKIHERLGAWSREWALRNNHKRRGKKVPSAASWAATCEQACLDAWQLVQAVREHTPAGRVEKDLHMAAFFMIVEHGRIKAGQLQSLADRFPVEAAHLAGNEKAAEKARGRMLGDLRDAGYVVLKRGWWTLPGGDS